MESNPPRLPPSRPGPSATAGSSCSPATSPWLDPAGSRTGVRVGGPHGFGAPRFGSVGGVRGHRVGACARGLRSRSPRCPAPHPRCGSSTPRPARSGPPRPARRAPGCTSAASPRTTPPTSATPPPTWPSTWSTACWRDAGHDVHYVQNVTDVDDPLLERAARDRRDWVVLADARDRAVPRGHGGAAGAAAATTTSARSRPSPRSPSSSGSCSPPARRTAPTTPSSPTSTSTVAADRDFGYESAAPTRAT